jgi:predicted N-acetyltransferase YhbS
MVTIRHERPTDIAAREALLDQCFGSARFAKTSERLREGRRPAEGLSLVAADRGRLAGTVRLWHVRAGHDRPALLLGPLAVDSACRNRGIGAALMARAIVEARRRGHRLILLVGDEPYYTRFGFSAAGTGALSLPGPYERHRLLSLSLMGEMGEAAGLVRATGISARPPLRTAKIGEPDAVVLGRVSCIQTMPVACSSSAWENSLSKQADRTFR